jgi:hypothetical protein
MSQATALATSEWFTTNNGSNTRRSGVSLNSAAGSIGDARARLLALPPDPGSKVTAAQSIFRLLGARPPPCAFVSSHQRRYKKRSDFWSHVRNSFAEKCGSPVSRMIMVSEEEVLDSGACQEDAVAACFERLPSLLGLCVCGCLWMRARACPCAHRSKQADKLAPGCVSN